MNQPINEIIEKFPTPISGLINIKEIKTILQNLQNVIHLDGDIIELGCNIGATTLYVQKYLNKINSKKTIHVYDSFQGIPLPNIFDKNHLKKGYFNTTLSNFKFSFEKENLKLPIINEGWFSEISDVKYPDKICFAFFDSDLHDSIMDSFKKTYHKIIHGGKILIHDYNFSGVKKACDDFLKEKPCHKKIFNCYGCETLIVTKRNIKFI